MVVRERKGEMIRNKNIFKRDENTKKNLLISLRATVASSSDIPPLKSIKKERIW